MSEPATTPKDAKRGLDLPPWAEKAFIPIFFVVLVLLPFTMDSGGALLGDATLALAYVVMALGLNIIVGFAGLLDLGYVAFFAIGAYTMGWLGSEWTPAVVFGYLILIMVFKPSGLLGEQTRDAG